MTPTAKLLRHSQHLVLALGADINPGFESENHEPNISRGKETRIFLYTYSLTYRANNNNVHAFVHVNHVVISDVRCFEFMR